ncbi:MAG: hypothetical protein RLZZ31_1530 [Actinomycetota bacterium]
MTSALDKVLLEGTPDVVGATELVVVDDELSFLSLLQAETASKQATPIATTPMMRRARLVCICSPGGW